MMSPAPGPVGGGSAGDSESSVSSVEIGISFSASPAIADPSIVGFFVSSFLSASQGTFLHRVTKRVVVSSTGSKWLYRMDASVLNKLSNSERL